jgi:putative hydrolase of the HAD superfamily
VTKVIDFAGRVLDRPELVPRAEAAGLLDAVADKFARIDTWVFDLDNTLYSPDCDLWPKIDARITLFMGHLFGLDGISSRALQKYYYQHYGTTLHGLMQEYGVSAHDFLRFAHDIDRSSLTPDPRLAAAISGLPGRKLVFTNGSRDHAELTAAALGLGGLFDAVFDIADADFVPKPAPENYARFFDRHSVDPTRAVMFEDLARNLVIPHERGMTTVLVAPKPGEPDHREPFEIASELVPSHVDFMVTDLGAFLLEIGASRNPGAA